MMWSNEDLPAPVAPTTAVVRPPSMKRVHAGENLALAVVGEMHVVEHHAAVVRVAQGQRRVGQHRLIEQAANAAPSGHRVRHLGEHVPEQAQGEDQQCEQVHHTGDLADGHRPGPGSVRAAEHEQDCGRRGHAIEQGLERAAQPHRADPGLT